MVPPLQMGLGLSLQKQKAAASVVPLWTPSEITTAAWYDASDGDTLTTDGVPTAEHGILDLTANGGINPKTGQPWKVGDQYRLCFLASTLSDALSADINTYNTLVQNAATAEGLGGTWKAFVSTPTVNARVNCDIKASDIDTALFDVNSLIIGNDVADVFDGSVNEKIQVLEDGTAAPTTLAGSPPFNGFGPIWTGCSPSGATENPVGGGGNVNFGIASAGKTYQFDRGNSGSKSEECYIIAVSEVLTIQAVGSGSVVQWDDKSGGNHHLTQAVGSRQPVSDVRTIGGLNAIDYNAANVQFLTNGDSIVSGNPDLLIAAVVIHDAPVTSASVVADVGDGQAGTSASINGGSAGYSWRFYNGHVAYGAQDTGVEKIQVGVRPSGGDYVSSEMWIDGTEQASTSSSNGTPAIAAGLGVGGRASGSGTNLFDGAIGEVIVVEDSTEETRQKIEGYLAHKWGLESNLPALHPYKSSPPVA